MSEKEISIHLKTQGGEAAAAAVKRVDEAVKQLDSTAEAAAESMASLGESTGSTGGGSSSSGGAATGGQRRSRAKKGAAAAMKELAEEAPRASASTSKVGQIAAQAGFQVQDFAVQVGGGTSALTAFAQQGSQLLGIFGPQGAIAGAVLALGAVAYKVFDGMADAPKEAAEAMADIDAKLKKLTETRLEASAESGAEGVRKWIEVFDKEAEAIERANRNLAANIELIRAKRRADAEIASAEDALELAHIDANSSMSEEDKIRARAGVKRRGDRRKAQDDLNELNLQDQKSEASAAKAYAESKKANEKATSISGEITSGEEEAARLKALIGRADLGRASLPGAEGAASQAEQRLQELRSARESAKRNAGPLGDLQSGPTDIELKEAAEEVQKTQEALEEARRMAASANNGERRRLAQLEGRGNKAGSLDELRDQLEAAQKAADEARQASNDAGRQRDEDRKKTAEAARSVVGRYQLGLQATDVSTESRATQARQKAEDKAKKEQEQNDRTALRDQIANQEAALDASAEDASGKFGAVARRGNVVGGKQGDRLVKTLDSISQRLSDGTTEAEIARIGKQFEDATRGVGGQTIELLRQMVTEQQRQATAISALRAKYQRGPSSDR